MESTYRPGFYFGRYAVVMMYWFRDCIPFDIVCHNVDADIIRIYLCRFRSAGLVFTAATRLS